MKGYTIRMGDPFLAILFYRRTVSYTLAILDCFDILKIINTYFVTQPTNMLINAILTVMRL